VRVAFFGELGSGNTGNDGSFEAVLDWVRRGAPEAQPFAICTGPADVAARFGIPAHPREPQWLGDPLIPVPGVLVKVVRRFGTPFWLYRRLQGTDWVIVPGAGVLESAFYRPWMLPLALYMLTQCARATGTRVALVNIGVDRAKSRSTRWLAAQVARNADYLTLRDRASLAALRALHVGASPDQVYPDLAFNLESPPQQTPRPRSVAVGLMSFFEWRGTDAERVAYEASMVSLVEWLLQEGYSVRLLTGDSGDDPYLKGVLDAVRARHPDLDPDRLVGEPARDLHQLANQISEVEVVVAARFHNVIISLKLGKPILALTYAPKVQSALELFGLSRFSHPIAALDLPRLEEQFNEMYRRRAEIGEGLRGKVAEVEAEARAQGERFVSDFLLSPPPPGP
jgi:polysaccharide pyruvyl transferase WcaK-like protein